MFILIKVNNCIFNVFRKNDLNKNYRLGLKSAIKETHRTRSNRMPEHDVPHQFLQLLILLFH